MTEHDRVTECPDQLNPTEYIGYHRDSDIAVLTDSGYDCEKIQNVIPEKGRNIRHRSEKFPGGEVRGGIRENTEVPQLGRGCHFF